LTERILSLEWKNDINTIGSLGCRGKMVCEYYELLVKLWTKKENYVSPKPIKKTLQRSFDRFVGYDQQDSQEFLGCFLDLLHEDLNKILFKPYLNFLDYKGQELQEFSQKNWDLCMNRDNSIISKSFDIF
jgi:ubiquitin carboxyl-terminal hydrolase 4/11/15